LKALYDRIVQNEIKMDGGGIFAKGAKQGYLKKMSDNMQWQFRWFVLSNNCLHYFDNEKQDRPTEIIPLEGLRVTRGSQMKLHISGVSSHEHPFVFCVHDPDGGKVKSVRFVEGSGSKAGDRDRLTMCASSPEEMEEWMEAISLSIVGNPFHEIIKIKKEVLMKDKKRRRQLSKQVKAERKVVKKTTQKVGKGLRVREEERRRESEGLRRERGG